MNFPERPKGLSNVVSIKDKEQVIGLLRGDPFLFRQHWLGQKAFMCEGDECKHCRDGLKSTFRFRMNIIVGENKVWVVKILEQGGKVYDALKGLADAGYDLKKTFITISRSGSTQQNTYYTVLPHPSLKVEATGEAQFSKLVLNNLNPNAKDDDYLHDADSFDPDTFGEITA